METQQTALTTSGESQAHSESLRARLINEWLLKFAVAYPVQGNREPVVTKETAPLLAGIWSEALADIPTGALEPAFRATLQSSKWFPTVADIRSHIESAHYSRAEDEWQNLLEYCRRYVNRDTVRDNPPPRLPSDIDHASRAAGGIFYLASCSEKDLIFAKQRFIEDLTRQRKSRDIAGFLPCSELQEMLQAAAQCFALPPAAQEYFGRVDRKSLPGPVVSIHENWRSLGDAQRSYGVERKHDPAFAEMIRRGEQKYHAAIDKVCAEWREAHNL